MKSTKTIKIISVIIILLIIGVCVGYVLKLTQKVQNPIATIEVEGFGTMKFELYPDKAPETVANFITLANREFYDGLTFHRIIEDFMIQGGDKNGDGTGSPSLSDLKDGVEEDRDYSIKGEFVANGYSNDIRHEKGVISMARSDYSNLGLYEEGYNSAGSQFFIMTKETSYLNGQYAAFGKLIEGEEVLDKLAQVEVNKSSEEDSDKPVNPPVIKSIRVETYGLDYGMPETLEPFNYYNWLSEQYGIDSSYLTQSTETIEQ